MRTINLKKHWWLFALILIFLISYLMRAVNIAPDRLLSFDPIYQYRFTKYLVDWGHLPLWDELTYYAGRIVSPATVPPLIFYLTSMLFLFLSGLNFSLLTTASYASAIYGAMIVIPTFLLGRELSNKYGGLLSAVLIGTAPQILIRTFGSSYDTDQLVLFFLLLTLYLGYVALKKKTVASFSLALIGFTLFMLTWIFFLYPFFILLGFVLIYFLLNLLAGKLGKRENFSFKNILSELKNHLKFLVIIIICLFIIGWINGIDVTKNLLKLTGFVQTAEKSIVNISIAELQPFNIFNFEGWILATGRFVNMDFITNIVFIVFIFFMVFNLIYFLKGKKDLKASSFLLTIFFVGIYTSFRGMRFTEFTSTLFLILIGSGFGYFIEYCKNKKYLKTISIGVGVMVIFIAISIGFEVGRNLGPDINTNWDDAWEFLKTKTPESSIVGTWWDPGHMIAGTAERRNYADGAHCPSESCLYPINTRITELGKIMATNDENESLELIRKYQGNSEKVYWIASDDLIGKFRWLQYFGTGCDGTTDSSCPLYTLIQEGSRSLDNFGNILLRNYDINEETRVIILHSGQLSIPIFIQGINAVLFDEFIIYNNTEPVVIKFTKGERNAFIKALEPLERQLNIRFTNQTMQMTVWIPRHFSYVVIIPPKLRNNVFTKMFMLEGQGLEYFKQVFRNEQVKIYEII